MRKNILILGHNAVTHFVDIFNQYTRLFDKNHFAVTVAYLTGEPDDTIRQRTLAEEVIFLNLPKKALRYLKIRAIKQLLALCRQQHYELVICHRYKPTYIMLWVAQFCRIPACIFVMHELGTMNARGRQLLIACLQRKNMLFAGVSNAVRDDMRKDLWGVPQKRVATLYNMIDVELTEPQLFSKEQARETLHIAEDIFIFGNVARLVPNKDQATLIQAFAMIKPHCPHAKLLIIGTGDLATTLKQQVATCGLNEDVIFTGYLPQGFRYMKALDCFVLSSIQEAFGRVLLEAMLAHLPIIATRVHGIPEVVGEAGILVNPQDVNALAQAMQHIYQLSVNERKACGDKAYQHAIKHFSIPIFQEHWGQVLTLTYYSHKMHSPF